MNLFTNPCKLLRYMYYDFWEANADPRTRNFPLISGGPNSVVTIIGVYLLLVTAVGPKWMKHRHPFSLKGLMIVFNFIMAATNCAIVLYLLFNINFGKVFLDFKFPNPNDTSPIVLHELDLGFWCYMTKFADLLDTIFFVLRKKDRQITFLHLYHHSSVPIFGWMALKIAPQVPAAKLFLLLNCLVHTVMYLYYGLAAFGPHMQKSLWWKKYITQLQLYQFAVFIFYGCLLLYFQQGYPPEVIWLGLAQNPLFFYMFWNFYQKSYKQTQIRNENLKNK